VFSVFSVVKAVVLVRAFVAADTPDFEAFGIGWVLLAVDFAGFAAFLPCLIHHIDEMQYHFPHPLPMIVIYLYTAFITGNLSTW
jgi:hypothetical protein